MMLVALLFMLFGLATARIATLEAPTPDPVVSLLGEYSIPSGTRFANTTVGGLSGVTYDATRGVYYLVSDARRTHGAHRFYTAEIDLAGPTVRVTAVTFLRRSNGDPFDAADLDPEGIQYTDADTIVVSSERDPPAIIEFGLDGKLLRYFYMPPYYLPNSRGTYGTRNNLGFEGLSLSPDGKTLWAANEAPLVQDGPVASEAASPLSGFVSFDMGTRVPTQEYLYRQDLMSGGDATAVRNGVTEIVALDDGGNKFLVLERSSRGPRPGTVFGARLYVASVTNDTVDVHETEAIAGLDLSAGALDKTLLVDVGALGIVPGNAAGLQIVRTSCNEAIVIVVADDDFSGAGSQSNQFVFLKVRNI